MSSPVPLNSAVGKTAPVPQAPTGSNAARETFFVLMCKNCDDPRNPDPDIVEDWVQGDSICRKCGMVVGALIDQRSEWRTFADSTDDPSRAGGPEDTLTMDLIGVQSSISVTDGGSGHAKDLQRAQARNSNTAGQREALARLKEIDNYCAQLHLPKTVSSQAKIFFKNSMNEFKNRKPKAVIAAAIILACRQGAHRTIREIASQLEVEEKDVSRAFTKMKDFLKVETTGAKPEELMARYGDALDMDFKLKAIAKHVVQKAMEIPQVSSKSPLTIAASSIFIVCNAMSLGKTMKDVANVFEIAEETVRNTYKEMYLYRLQLFPPDLKTVKSLADLPLY